jgi:hypothetical protein
MQITADAGLVTVKLLVLMNVRSVMGVRMAVRAAIRMALGVRMNTQWRLVVAMGQVVGMIVGMHRAILMNMGMLGSIYARCSLDFRFLRTATANCAHRNHSYSISTSLTRISVPPVACNW